MFFNKKSIKMIEKPNRIELIHNEFETAYQKILDEANNILREQETKLTKMTGIDMINSLKNIGFTKMKQVKDLDNIEENKNKYSEINNKSLYYKTNYPNFKFITDEYVDMICKKYNLIFGEIEDYIGNIPEKNQQEIINFKLRDEDRLMRRLYRSPFTFVTSFQYEKYDEKSFKTYNNYFGRTSASDNPVFFKIVADEELFDLTDRVIKNNRIEKLDPVVLAVVDGGYLVVSKWGNEENIEELK